MNEQQAQQVVAAYRPHKCPHGKAMPDCPPCFAIALTTAFEQGPIAQLQGAVQGFAYAIVELLHVYPDRCERCDAPATHAIESEDGAELHLFCDVDAETEIPESREECETPQAVALRRSIRALKGEFEAPPAAPNDPETNAEASAAPPSRSSG